MIASNAIREKFLKTTEKSLIHLMNGFLRSRAPLKLTLPSSDV
jgi:hypothetical protein